MRPFHFQDAPKKRRRHPRKILKCALSRGRPTSHYFLVALRYWSRKIRFSKFVNGPWLWKTKFAKQTQKYKKQKHALHLKCMFLKMQILIIFKIFFFSCRQMVILSWYFALFYSFSGSVIYLYSSTQVQISVWPFAKLRITHILFQDC